MVEEVHNNEPETQNDFEMLDESEIPQEVLDTIAGDGDHAGVLEFI